MAQAGNTGTPPASGAPEGQGGNAGEGGNQPGQPGGKRLIAGKYETIEDAVEQGIFGMEKAFHQTREDLAKVTRILEHAVGNNRQPQPPVDPRGGYAPVGSPGRGYDAYGRGAPPNDPDWVDPAQFIVNPSQYLAVRDQRILGKVANVVENVVYNAMVVAEFKRQHPDLIPHERVVHAFMNETDPSKDYASRLADAAHMTKEYLARVREPSNPPPTGNNFVEHPRGGASPNSQVPIGSPQPDNQSEDEKELYDYIAERNKDISARFGIKV